MRTLTRQDLSDILHGAAILGTGGGGELSEGFDLIDDALSRGKTFVLAGLDEVPDDALICTPYMLGAISPLPEAEERQYDRLARIDEPPILLAYRRFETYLGRRFYGTISCELGGSNTAIAFYAAAMNGGFIIDADPAGRAVPEITHSTYYLNNLPAGPIVMANEFGECMVCENVFDDLRAESIVRALSMVSRNDIAAIDHALEMNVLRNAVIPARFRWPAALGVPGAGRERLPAMRRRLSRRKAGARSRFGAPSARMTGRPATALPSGGSRSRAKGHSTATVSALI